MWSTRNQGFGGDGSRSMSGCVTTGPFRYTVWRLVGGTCLTRGFNGNTPNSAQVRAVENLPDFRNFELALRVNLHDTVHCRISMSFRYTVYLI